jgi:hypothetical protein
MGEVVPRDTSAAIGDQNDAELAENRRVDFHIVKQLGPLELATERNWSISVPWSGDAAQAAQPPPNQNVNAGIPTENEGFVPAKEDEPGMDVNLFLDDDEDEEEDEISFDDIGNDVEEDAETEPAEEDEAPEEDSSDNASETEPESAPEGPVPQDVEDGDGTGE